MAAVTSHENDLLTPFGSDKTLKFRGWKWGGGGGGIDQATETPYHKGTSVKSTSPFSHVSGQQQEKISIPRSEENPESLRLRLF